MSCPRGMKEIIPHGGTKNRNIQIYNILKYVAYVLNASHLPAIDPDDMNQSTLKTIINEFDWEPLWERYGD